MSGLPIISIDPGHNCTPDIGASASIGGILASEDKLNMEIATELVKLCTAVGIGTIWCMPSSASSVLDSLQQRVALANQGGATIYVAIHFNVADPTDSPRGTEVYGISQGSQSIAKNVLAKVCELGFKDRGVKTALEGGSPPYVLKHTNCYAVLVECCFLDSKVDRIILGQVGTAKIAKAIFNGLTEGMDFEPTTQELLQNNPRVPNKPPGNPIPTPVPNVPVGLTVGDILDRGDCSTTAVAGLTKQIIEILPHNLVKLEAPNFKPGAACYPYFQPHVRDALALALAEHPDIIMTCNSAYRSPVQQLMLRTHYERGRCGIGLAAKVGLSQHEQGLAIDVSEWGVWKPILFKYGFEWQGSLDPVHFGMINGDSIASDAIRAFQELFNQYNSVQIDANGEWNLVTQDAVKRSPCNGWSGQVSTRSLQLGMSGLDVVQLAQKLRVLGYYPHGITDNEFSPLLKSAVKAFQTDRGLTEDGIAGKMTLGLIDKSNYSKFRSSKP